MSEPIDQLRMTLKQHHQSLTHVRQVVFLALQGHDPQTMRELIGNCGGRVDRASIYRAIAVFEKLGIVQRLQIGWKYKLELSDAFVHHHHHLTCSQCGRTTALSEDDQLERRLQTIARELGFEPQDHQIEIRGRCLECQLKSGLIRQG